MAEEVLTLWLLVALLASGSSGGGGPLPPEVHHFKKAMSASLRMRGSFEEMVVSRKEIGSLIVTFLVVVFASDTLRRCWACCLAVRIFIFFFSKTPETLEDALLFF